MRDYIKKYPWLKIRNLYNGEIDEESDAMDDMPEGWKIAFGDLMLEELDKVIKAKHIEDDFVVEQVKEKYGSLRFYVNNADRDVWDIIDKYEALSEHVCIHCGKPDVPMLNMSWISPYCPECFKKLFPNEKKTYEELSSEETRMPTVITFQGFRYGERYTRSISTAATAEAIRRRYSERINKS